MKKRKRIFRKFSYRECDAFAAFLHEQSLKGWHFKEWKAGLVFERGEKADVLYDVQVFPKGKERDLRPEADAREYVDYCEAAGWKLVDGKGRFCIFRQCDGVSIPIVTEEEKLQNICAVERKEWLKETICYALMTALFFSQYVIWPVSAMSLYDNVILCLVAIVLVRFLWRMADGIWLLRWSTRQKKKLAAGEKVTYDEGGLQKRFFVNLREYLSFGILFALIWQAGYEQFVWPVVVVVAVFAVLEILFSYLRPERELAWITQALLVVFVMCMVIGFVPLVLFGIGFPSWRTQVRAASSGDMHWAEEAPLSLEDFKEVEGEKIVKECFWKKGVFGEMFSYWVEYELVLEEITEEELAELSSQDIEQLKMQRTESEGMSYEVYQSKYPWMIEKTWKTIVKPYYDVEVCTEQWDAVYAEVKKSYAESTFRTYFVRYADAVWLITSEEPLSDEQIRIVREKLDTLRKE